MRDLKQSQGSPVFLMTNAVEYLKLVRGPQRSLFTPVKPRC